MSRMRGSLKHALNKLIDELVHKGKHPKDVGTMIADELLHTCVEGEFRLDKFVRYNLLPLLNPRKTRPRYRKRRKNEPH